jgi:hypothetical protein
MSLSPDVATNNDGSIDLWFASAAPSSKKSNWVQTVPGKSWFTILRLYGLLEAWFRQVLAAGRRRTALTPLKVEPGPRATATPRDIMDNRADLVPFRQIRARRPSRPEHQNASHNGPQYPLRDA